MAVLTRALVAQIVNKHLERARAELYGHFVQVGEAAGFDAASDPSGKHGLLQGVEVSPTGNVVVDLTIDEEQFLVHLDEVEESPVPTGNNEVADVR